MNDDHELLQRYVRKGEQEAFRELVSRYAGLVYSAAMRHVREAVLAEEVAQNVFTLLAMKGKSVPREASLAGWLHKSACHLSRHACRSEARRRARESAAMTVHPPEGAAEPAWEDLQPVLDESLDSLKSDDREAVLLRFMRGLSFREVGGVLRTSEDGARMKINRALEKLRGLLARRGITSTSAALSGTLATHAMAMVPAELARNLSTHALGTASHTANITQIALMSTKAKAVFITAGAALTAVIGTPLVMQREKNLRNTIVELEDRIAGLSTVPTTKSASSGNQQTKTAGTGSTTANAAVKPGSASDTAAQLAQAKALMGNNNAKAAMGEAMANMAKMPGMKELMKSQTKPIIEKMYADLLDSLWQLNPEQRAKAIDALVDPMSEAQMGAMKMLQGGMTKDLTEEMAKNAKIANEKRDAALKEIVNDPEKWALFAKYEESSGERMKLNQLRESLGASDPALALTETQEEKLMNMMYQARKAAKADVPFQQETRFDLSLFTEEALKERQAKGRQMDEKILAEAGSILKPGQLAVFKESLKSHRAMEDASMDMAKALFGKAAEGEPNK
ncbi:MAG TPA: sigma-70 family RNA polymerase sigma factor [Verrucomicrobiales bacterium]|nr:sigma-70 family RNA polymerase sigma factor [Verrucomicrobiales bacterium]